MKELSVFVDESGDFATSGKHSSYYVISLVMHDQQKDLTDNIEWINKRLNQMGYPDFCFHAGPIMRNEHPFRKFSPESRRQLLRTFTTFIRRIDIICKTIFIEKKHMEKKFEETDRLSTLLSGFIKDHYPFFQSFDRVKVYYDNGQVEVSRLLSSVFGSHLENVEFRRVLPKDYRLFQAADFVATLKLLEIKLERGEITSGEEGFFISLRNLKKNYLKVLHDKSLP